MGEGALVNSDRDFGCCDSTVLKLDAAVAKEEGEGGNGGTLVSRGNPTSFLVLFLDLRWASPFVPSSKRRGAFTAVNGPWRIPSCLVCGVPSASIII